mgnify:CR=1 FL=1
MINLYNVLVLYMAKCVQFTEDDYNLILKTGLFFDAKMKINKLKTIAINISNQTTCSSKPPHYFLWHVIRVLFI